MGSKATQRQERIEALRKQHKRQELRSRAVVFGGAGAVVALVAAAVVWAVATTEPTSASSAAPGAGISGLKSFTDLSREHQEGTVSYAQTPPVGGAHAAVWQNCGWYDSDVASENAVHSLEHSAVWVTYDPGLSATDRATLKSELAGKQYVLASPFPGLPGPVVASAWGKQVVLDGVSDPRLEKFLTAFAGASTAPEPGGECTGGIGTPS